MLGMLIFLLPLVPGGGGSGDDLARVTRIADSVISYRLGWLGWQITALSDLLFGAALIGLTEKGTVARRWALISAGFTIIAVIPDQAAQFLLVTRGVELAREAAQYKDAKDFIAFEDSIFPLTTGVGAVFYTLGAIGWAFTFRAIGLWNRVIARLTAPMLTLFMAISVAPLLPISIRPRPELIGGGNALAFTILEGWFVAAWFALRRSIFESRAQPQNQNQNQNQN
jgi:hypothetical protein